jgi:hypothetical protein
LHYPLFQSASRPQPFDDERAGKPKLSVNPPAAIVHWIVSPR